MEKLIDNRKTSSDTNSDSDNSENKSSCKTDPTSSWLNEADDAAKNGAQSATSGGRNRLKEFY